MNKTRILYLSNHMTLSKFEVPMLQDMGYEVYMPKKPDFDISCRVDWELDKTLSIPNEDIAILNDIDFYYGTLNEQQVSIINKYFDIVFMVSYGQMMKNILNHFAGVICFRAFGTGITYTEWFSIILGYSAWNQIEKLGNRFWFCAGYQSITDSEGEFLQSRNLFMPLGLPNAVVNDRWQGGGRRILFPCPQIRNNIYFSDIYENFKRDFNKLPYIITGKQPIAVKEDPNVLGYLSEDEYVNVYTTSSCMYYYSQFKTHIHYTPAEAVRWGLPLLYLGGGLLDTIGGQDLPGRCENVQEVRKKAIRLINGDKWLAGKIRQSQSVLLEVFSEKYCRKHWEKAMQVIQDSVPKRKPEIVEVHSRPKKRIGVVLPEAYLGGVLDYTIRLIKALNLGAKACHDDIDIIFAHVASNAYNEIEHFSELNQMGIPIRSFVWEKISSQQVEAYGHLKGIASMHGEERYIPNDGCGCFRDCDFLIFTADRVPGHTFIPIPYAAVLHDYIQRMVSNIFHFTTENIFLRFCHNSTFQITTTPVTKEHAVQHGLLPKDDIHIIPILVDGIQAEGNAAVMAKLPEKYFIWSTNSNFHKNHKMALRALSEYYLRGGKLKCCMTGVDTSTFSKSYRGERNDYQTEIYKMIEENPMLKNNIKILGNMPKEQYWSVLKAASVVMHPGYADNGNFTCFDAAYLGVPTLSSKYPAMEYTDAYFNLGMSFFDPFDEATLTTSLFEAEQDLPALKKRLPSQEQLDRLVVSHPSIYTKIYQTLKFHINC